MAIAAGGEGQVFAKGAAVGTTSPSCDKSFDDRFSWAVRSVHVGAHSSVPEEAAREVYRRLLVCPGDDILIGDGPRLLTPKGSGVSISSEITGLVGQAKTIRMKGKNRFGRTSVWNCTVTGYTPQWRASDTSARGGGVLDCGSYFIKDLSMNARLQRLDGMGNQADFLPPASFSYLGYGTGGSLWQAWKNCVDPWSYRSRMSASFKAGPLGAESSYGAVDVSFWIASPDAYCA